MLAHRLRERNADRARMNAPAPRALICKLG
jgi:hypothetical protein